MGGRVSVSVQGVSVQVSVRGGGGLCPGVVSVEGRGSFSGGVSVRGGSLSMGGLCPGEGGLCHGDPQYSNEWVVRILLECILVFVILISSYAGKCQCYW